MATGLGTLFDAGSFIGAPILEGVLIQKEIGGRLEGWRVEFYVGVGLYAIISALLLIFYRPMPRPNPEGLKVWQRVSRLDWLGIFFASPRITLFLVGINYDGNPHQWSSGNVLGPLVSGAAVLVVFGLWEWKGTSNGFLPHSIFQARNYNCSLIIRISGGFALFGCQVYLPQMVVYVFGTDGLLTAVWQLPVNVSTILGSLVSAVVVRYYKEVRWVIMAVLLTLLLGAGLMIHLSPDSPFVAWFFPTAVMGLAIGCGAAFLTVIAGITTPDKLIATAVCVTSAAGLLGGSVATTMYGRIINSKSREILPVTISNAVLNAGLPESSFPDFLAAFQTQDEQCLEVVPEATLEVLQSITQSSRSAYAEVFMYIWITLIVFCVVTVAASTLLTSTTTYFTSEVSAPVLERLKMGDYPRHIEETE